ncbi:MAG: hypothetical protein M5U28_34745 [Sandaracinaceae bacterium]|nr:hypothetical protein [Sandaracinaceae bacterium]
MAPAMVSSSSRASSVQLPAPPPQRSRAGPQPARVPPSVVTVAPHSPMSHAPSPLQESTQRPPPAVAAQMPEAHSVDALHGSHSGRDPSGRAPPTATKATSAVSVR